MKSILIYHYQSPFGEIVLGSFDDALCLCAWSHRKKRQVIDKRLQNHLSTECFVLHHEDLSDAPIIAQATSQLAEYFNRQRTEFTVPLLMVGSVFQKSVWQKLLKIRYGQTNSYLWLAQEIKNPRSVRAVANANGANALSIFVPCHRIIGNRGDLVGYAGGLDTKKKLLELENNSLFCVDTTGSR